MCLRTWVCLGCRAAVNDRYTLSFFALSEILPGIVRVKIDRHVESCLLLAFVLPLCRSLSQNLPRMSISYSLVLNYFTRLESRC